MLLVLFTGIILFNGAFCFEMKRAAVLKVMLTVVMIVNITYNLAEYKKVFVILLLSPVRLRALFEAISFGKLKTIEEANKTKPYVGSSILWIKFNSYLPFVKSFA